MGKINTTEVNKAQHKKSLTPLLNLNVLTAARSVILTQLTTTMCETRKNQNQGLLNLQVLHHQLTVSLLQKAYEIALNIPQVPLSSSR